MKRVLMAVCICAACYQGDIEQSGDMVKAESSTDELEMEVSLSETPVVQRTFFFFGRRKMPARLTLTNVSQDSMAIERPVPNATVLAGFFSGTEKVSPDNVTFVNPEIDEDYFVILAPGQSYSTKLDLLGVADVELHANRKYHAEVVYAPSNENYYNGAVPLFEGSLVVRTRTFEL